MAKSLVRSGRSTRTHGVRRSLAPLFAALLASLPALVSAQPTAEELSTARQLFRRGVELEDAGDWAGALATYDRIAKVMPTPVVLFRVGVCHEKLGHSVAALNAYELATREAERRNQTDVLDEAKRRAEGLARRTPHLVIELPADAEDVTIELDGRAISVALAGTRVLVDPGEHFLVVRSDRYTEVFEAQFSLIEREDRTVTVALGERRPAPALVAAVPLAPRRDRPVLANPPAPSRAPLFIGAAATLSLTSAALATGLLAHAKHSDYEEANADPSPGSLDERTALRDDGKSLALVSTMLTAGALLAGGATAYLYFTGAPRAAPPAVGRTPVTWLSPWVAGSGAGLVAWGPL